MQALATRQLLDPLSQVPRRTDLTSVSEAPAAQAGVIELEGDATPGYGASSSALGWVFRGAAPLLISLRYAPDRVGGAETRTGILTGSAVAPAVPTGPFAKAILDPESLGSWSREGQLWLDPIGEGSRQSSASDVMVVETVSSTASVGLLEGVSRADWEGLDREIRRLLAGIGGLADPPDGQDAGSAWLLWIGAAAVLFLAHRTSYGPRRFVGRPGSRLHRAGHTAPIPVGPWPLGPT